MERRRATIRVPDRGGPIEVPVVTLAAADAGPAVAITGNVHGDELTGVVAAHRLADRLATGLRRGRVHLLPSLNPLGLVSRSRTVGEAGPDLNRQFPGGRTGPLAKRLAGAVWDDLAGRGLDLLIDLHADSADAIPYAIVDRPVHLAGTARARMDARLLDLASVTGLTVLHEYPDDVYLRFGLDRSLAGAMVNHAGIAAVTVEAGPRRVVDAEAVRITVVAVLRILAHLGLVDPVEPPGVAIAPGGPWRRTSGPRLRVDGVFDPRVVPGEPFARGAVLGVVRALDGEPLEEVRAPSAGIVVSWVDGSWLPAGAVVATLGVPEAPR